MLKVEQFNPPKNQREWAYWRDLVKNGKAIGVPDRESSAEPTNARVIRSFFSGHDYMARELDDIESVISYLTDEVVSDKTFQAPMSNSVEYLLVVNGHILIYLYGDDEYMGQGQSETYLTLKGVAYLDEDTPMDRELLEIAEWLQRAFTF